MFLIRNIMGGTALTHLGFQGNRVTKKDYFRIIKEIQQLSLGYIQSVSDVLHYEQKQNYGDIDLVGYCTSSSIEFIKKIYSPQYISKNSFVYSFDYQGVQIDLSLFNNLKSLEYYYCYSCFSPIGNILGRLVKQKGLKWGIDGLSYPIKLSESEQLGSILIECETPFNTFKKLLDFCGLKHTFNNCYKTDLRNYFKTQSEMFSWLCTSNLFNNSIFQFENLNHVNRKRDRLRTDYHNWLEFIKQQPSHFEQHEDKTFYLKEICDFFGVNIFREAEHLISKHQYNKFLKEKFNGKMVVEWTGVTGKELGFIINEFKKSKMPFDDYIQLKSADFIKKEFQEFFDLNFNK